MQEGSIVLVSSDEKDVVLNALGAKAEKDFLKGVMSRKKQVVPPLQQTFKA